MSLLILLAGAGSGGGPPGQPDTFRSRSRFNTPRRRSVAVIMQAVLAWLRGPELHRG